MPAILAARMAACRGVEAEFFTLVDGGEDSLLPDYKPAMLDLAEEMRRTGSMLGSFRMQRADGSLGGWYRHGVIVRGSVLSWTWPSGMHSFETLIYGALAKLNRCVLRPGAVYCYRPSPNGMATWPESDLARRNSTHWIDGRHDLYAETPDEAARQTVRRLAAAPSF